MTDVDGGDGGATGGERTIRRCRPALALRGLPLDRDPALLGLGTSDGLTGTSSSHAPKATLSSAGGGDRAMGCSFFTGSKPFASQAGAAAGTQLCHRRGQPLWTTRISEPRHKTGQIYWLSAATLSVVKPLNDGTSTCDTRV
jgi:hypothetical protein